MARRDLPGPYSLDTLAALPAPALFTTDPEVLRTRYIAWFQAATGRTLYPAQVEMLLINMLAYAMSLVGEEAQAVAEQHLVSRADAGGLELLGPNRSTPRLPAATARTTVRFTLTAARATRLVIPAGTRVRAEDNGPIFSIVTPAAIPAGALTAEVVAEAEVAGEEANGFLVGQITTMMDPVAGVTVSNLTPSSGGADLEDVEAYRLRIANAFERISTGGSWAWYVEETFKVSSAIVDVAVIRPEPCYVDIYPLTRDGPAGPELRAQVAAAFNTAEALDIRFGDAVTVQVAPAVNVTPTLTVRYRGPSPLAAVQAAAEQVLADWRERLGATVIPGDVEAAVRAVAGVVDAQVAGLAFQQLGAAQYFTSTLTIEMVQL